MTLMAVTSSTAGRRHVADPSLTDVVAAIRSLDGEGEVELDAPGRGWLGVAGGPQKYFLGYGRESDGALMQARALQTVGGIVQMVIGGQATSIADEYVVPLEAATAAALYFLQTGEADPALDWEQM